MKASCLNGKIVGLEARGERTLRLPLSVIDPLKDVEFLPIEALPGGELWNTVVLDSAGFRVIKRGVCFAGEALNAGRSLSLVILTVSCVDC